MGKQNSELLILQEFEEDHIFTEEEAEQIKREALMICAAEIESVRQDFSKLIADLSVCD